MVESSRPRPVGRTSVATDTVGTDAPDPAVVISGISKRYGRIEALTDISFSVNDNEMFALLGPNGAGKTTLIHILCTILRPDSGTARVAGEDVLRQPTRVRRRLGVVFQEPSLDGRLTLEENLNFHGLVYGVPRALRRRRIEELLELVELGDWRGKLARTLSSGMKRRAEIARALIHDARVIILDEPTVGLDAQSRQRIWQYLRKLKEVRGLTVIVTTHYIDEVEGCDRICIIDRGRLLALDTPTRLKEAYGEEMVRLVPRDETAAAAILTRLPGAVRGAGGDIVVRVPHENGGERILAAFAAETRQVVLERASLESVFLNLTGREIRDRAAGAREQAEVRTAPGAEPPR
jgi:ABC-2 type transport system ATP-binding protein